MTNDWESWTGAAKLPSWAASRSDSATSLAAFVGVPLGLGLLVGFVSQPAVLGSWYRNLRKPSWQPPAFIFGPVWSILYVLMGLSSWMVWTHGGLEKQKLPLTLYGIQLLLNLAWNPLFFIFHNLEAAFVDALGLVATVAMTMWKFHEVEPLAALMLIPYLAWVTFAAYLTSTLISMNPQETRTGLAIEREVVMEPVGGVGEVKQETVTLPLKKEE